MEKMFNYKIVKYSLLQESYVIQHKKVAEIFGITQGIIKGEALKLIMLVQKKARKGDSITKIADDLVEDEIVISPIYKMVKEYPEDTEKDIYQRLN